MMEDTRSYEQRIVDNVVLVAHASLSGSWTDGPSGKKLFNQAAMDEYARKSNLDLLKRLEEQTYERPSGTSDSIVVVSASAITRERERIEKGE